MSNKLFIIPVLLITLGTILILLNKSNVVETGRNSGLQPTNEFMMPSGFGISTYATLNGTPRDLETDRENTIFVSVPSQGKVMAIIDSSETKSQPEVKEIIAGLNFPHGLAYYNNKLFVAEENRVSRYDWNKKTSQAKLEKTLFPIPPGGRHRSRSLVFGNDGKLYISIGSTCDVCFESDSRHGSILVSDFEGNSPKIFASGLRNSVFMAIDPSSGKLYSTDMGRDNLGDHLPPDELNAINENGNYGWPLCFGNRVYDNVFARSRNLSLNGSCANTINPVVEIPAHSAPLGLVFIDSPAFPKDYQGNMLIALHGSWNSSKLVGYKVVRVNLKDGSNEMFDFVTGFLPDEKSVTGRPVDMVFDTKGNLYLSDDKSNRIYKINYFK